MIKVRLVRDSLTTWSIRTEKTVLCTFSNSDAVEAKRFAEAWLTSFAERINLEVPDECNPSK